MTRVDMLEGEAGPPRLDPELTPKGSVVLVVAIRTAVQDEAMCANFQEVRDHARQTRLPCELFVHSAVAGVDVRPESAVTDDPIHERAAAGFAFVAEVQFALTGQEQAPDELAESGQLIRLNQCADEVVRRAAAGLVDERVDGHAVRR